MSYNNVDKSTGNLIPVAGATLYADAPVGTIQAFGGTSIPDGWLACSGQAISRTDYADLYAVIGTYYGNGNGTTTFNVPDLREATPKGTGLSGKSSAHYSVGGITLGQFVDDQFQQWTATFNNINNRPTCTGIASYTQDGSEEPSSTNNMGGKITLDPSTTVRTGTTTEVKAVGVNFIIKAKKVGAPSDIIEGVASAINSYSTEETLTGGTWIDGKKIYRKCIFNTNSSQYLCGNDNVIEISMLGANVADTVIKFDVMVKNVDNTNSYINANSSWIKPDTIGNNFWCRFEGSTGLTKISSFDNGNHYYISSIVLEYTKV